NPSFERKLGYGRVNADRALRMNFPAVQLTEVNLIEGSHANKDSIFDPGEEIVVTFKVQNFLQPVTNIQLNFATNNPDITILNSFFSLSSLGRLEEWNNSDDPMRIEIDPDASRGQKVDVLLNISSTGGYQDYDYFNFPISPSYATIQGANVRLTLSSNGKLGFIDYPDNKEGEGFIFGNRGNLLFEGAVMAATAPDSVSDVARGLNANIQNSDFYSVPDGEIVIRRPGDLSSEQGKAVFTDENSPASLHLKITQTTMAFDDSLHEDYILVKYKIENSYISSLHGLYFGLFLDWDIDNVYANSPGFDPDLTMAYIYDSSTSIFGGCQIVSEEKAIAYRSILNEEEIYPDAGGYADAEKWTHLSKGIQPIGKTNPGDYSHVLGVGPMDLSPGDSVLVGFALLGGEGLDELKENASRAREKWQALFETTDVHNNGIITQHLTPELGNAYPNPFNACTNIHYEISEKSHVVLTVHNLIGQEIVRLIDEIQEPGLYEIQWNGETIQGRAASGVYCYKLKAGSFEQVRKMVLIQ
ncbi:MAG TPA: T9SS type A sorting domain-containing protein, partial [bacterium]